MIEKAKASGFMKIARRRHRECRAYQRHFPNPKSQTPVPQERPPASSNIYFPTLMSQNLYSLHAEQCTLALQKIQCLLGTRPFHGILAHHAQYLIDQ